MEKKPLPNVSEGCVLVSACLAGRACRFDGSGSKDDEVSWLVESGRAVLVCPEVDGGLPTPRPPAEIVGGDGADVLAGRARVVTEAGADITNAYLEGARRALEAARRSGASVRSSRREAPRVARASSTTARLAATWSPATV